MPYITQTDRDHAAARHPSLIPSGPIVQQDDLESRMLSVLTHTKGETAGTIVYLLTLQINAYLDDACTFAAFASVAYTIERCKEWSTTRERPLLTLTEHEFYRRVVAPYEDAKLAANGDVYSAAVLGTDTPTTTTGDSNGNAQSSSRSHEGSQDRRRGRLVARWFTS